MRKQLLIIILVVFIGWFMYSKIKHAVTKTVNNTEFTTTKQSLSQPQKIDELTKETVVVVYLKEHGQLPDYYITKKEAMKLGWQPASGNLCEAVGNKAIGGDVFTNRQRAVPTEKGRKWYEADLNYSCGRRGADRVVFSNDGLIYVTHNHYKTFQKR